LGEQLVVLSGLHTKSAGKVLLLSIFRTVVQYDHLITDDRGHNAQRPGYMSGPHDHQSAGQAHGLREPTAILLIQEPRFGSLQRLETDVGSKVDSDLAKLPEAGTSLTQVGHPFQRLAPTGPLQDVVHQPTLHGRLELVKQDVESASANLAAPLFRVFGQIDMK
jgi:hypothetical protein